MVTDYIRPFDGFKILDIGCGTGEYIHHIEQHCKNFEYYGFDGEGVYIDYAKKLFKGQSNIHFYHKILTEESIKEFNNFDIVIATGVMHHLYYPDIVSLLKLSKLALKPGGRLVTYDPGKFDNMSSLEKFFVRT
jgi:2-polyprenyl-3-methyl-5-hydroxy-6-metoxy-1,4-benzoquinol methylase